MLASKNTYNIIKEFEGFSNTAYLDTGGVATLGWGTTHYPNGDKVQKDDTCSLAEAQIYLQHDVQKAINKVNNLLWGKPLTQNQFDALVSFEYNTGHLVGSTLYKKAFIDPDDETIYKYKIDEKGQPIVDSSEFLRWVRDNGKIVKGLIFRRAKEADLYGTD